jgi:hypothetical protein
MEDEPKKEKTIYFIYAQRSEENDLGSLEINEKLKDIYIIKKDRIEEYNYILYSLILSNNIQENMISLFLTKSGEKYITSIDCLKTYPEKFIYKVDFKPFNKNIMNNLKQVTLPFKEQFIIFKTVIVMQNNNLLKSLCLSTLDCIHSIALINQKEDVGTKINFEFDLYLYLFANCLTLVNKGDNEIQILKSFFNEFNKDLIDIKKSYNNDNSNKTLIGEIVNQDTIDSLSDFNVLRTIIFSIDDGKESFNEKLDLILAYYYFNYKPRLFIDYISQKNERYEEVISNLKKNRNLFKKFTSELFNFDFLNEATNLSEMQSIFRLVPNIPELLKLLSMDALYKKFKYLSSIEGKIVNVYKIVPPNKEDDIMLLKKNYNLLKKTADNNGCSLFSLPNELFLEYSEFFYFNDLRKLEIIIEIYLDYYIKILMRTTESIENDLFYAYCETGLYLISNGKLFNADVINFIETLFKTCKFVGKLPEDAYKGITLTNDESFINDLLNGKFSWIEKSIEFVKSFFNSFKTLKDFLCLSNWDKKSCNKKEVFEICYNKLKDLWIKEKEKKLNKDLFSLFGRLFAIFSNTFEFFIYELIDLESIINNPDNFLNIYSFIICNDKCSRELEEHIKNYINSAIKDRRPLAIFYKVITLSEGEKIPFLVKNLSLEYAIKVEDFIKYPNEMSERIDLYIRLYEKKFFNYSDIKNLEYYKESIKAKDKLYTLKYKDAIVITKNLESFRVLFLYLLPNRVGDKEDYLIDILIIDFYENCNQCKEKFNNLKEVLNYWKHFFNYTKRVEINELTNFLNALENTPIKDFNQLENNINSFLYYMNEAEKWDKLYNSFFFMGLYNNSPVNFQQNEQEQKFQYTLMMFNELKILGKNSNIEVLPVNLLNQLTELIYKNNDRLDDELAFIKEYFESNTNKTDNNNNLNFDIYKIKRAFMNKVNNYKKSKNLDDYQMQFDDFTLMKYETNIKTNVENSISNVTKTDIDDDDDFNLFANDDKEDKEDKEEEGFTLLGDNDEKINTNTNVAVNKINENEIKKEEKVVSLLNEEEKKELLKDIKKLSYDYYYIFNIKRSYEYFDESIEHYNQKFNEFFKYVFENISKYNKLSEKEFYEEILCLMTKIFLSAIGINYFNKDNITKQTFLIYEFNEILDVYKRYHLINKLQINKIIEKFLIYKENEEGELNNIINSIDQLFTFLSDIDDIQKKAKSNLFIKLIVQETIKINNSEFNIKIIDFIMRDDYKYILNDSLPFLDEIFKKELSYRIQIDEDNINRITDLEDISNQFEKRCNTSKDFEELLLYYFESK